MEKIYEVTKGEAIITTDVGQHQMWVTQYLEMDEKKQLLTSGGLGTMAMVFRHPWAPNLRIRGNLWYVFPVTEECR